MSQKFGSFCWGEPPEGGGLLYPPPPPPPVAQAITPKRQLNSKDIIKVLRSLLFISKFPRYRFIFAVIIEDWVVKDSTSFASYVLCKQKPG